MKNYISKLIIFALGAAAGAAGSWVIVSKKYEKIINEEIESVKEAYSFKSDVETDELESQLELDLEETTEEKVEEKVIDKKKVFDDYKSLSGVYKKQDDYTDYSTNKQKRGELLKKKDESTAEVIPPDEFGDILGYDQITLTYYADDILEDENYVVISDDVEYVGTEYADSFGEWEDDCVYVRNDAKQCYFEIVKDERLYQDTVSMVDDE